MIKEALEKQITRGNCRTCPKNFKGICDVTEEKIGSGDEYCELRQVGSWFGKIICKVFGHPLGGNAYIVGEDTYCPRCGRMNLP